MWVLNCLDEQSLYTKCPWTKLAQPYSASEYQSQMLLTINPTKCHSNRLTTVKYKLSQTEITLIHWNLHALCKITEALACRDWWLPGATTTPTPLCMLLNRRQVFDEMTEANWEVTASYLRILHSSSKSTYLFRILAIPKSPSLIMPLIVRNMFWSKITEIM